MSKILSLDGGGTWALVEALALDSLYPGESGHEILSHFDVAVGNSGGAIILGGLISDLAPSAIANIICNEANRSKIYVKSSAIVARWSTSAKLKALQDLLPYGNKTFGSFGLHTDIIIPSFDIDTKSRVLFQTNAPSSACTLAEAINASSAAPILYFDEPAVVSGRRLWDGGLSGANSPAMLGIGFLLDKGEKAIDALSIGTGVDKRPVKPAGATDSPMWAPLAKTDFMHEISLACQVVLDGPTDDASAWANRLCRTHVRVSPSLSPSFVDGKWVLSKGYLDMGGITTFEKIVGLDMDVVDQDDVNIIRTLAEKWIAGGIPNSWGNSSFVEQKSRWKQVL